MRKISNNTHGLISNILFMLHEQWNFEKKGVLLPFIRILSDVAISVLSLWLPKIVLDTISKSVLIYDFLFSIIIVTTSLIFLTYISYYTEQSIFMSSVRIWNLHFYSNKQYKIVDMDYSIATSEEGKRKIIRSHWSLNRNVNVNMVSIYPHFIEFIKNLVGFITFSVILASLNPIIILLLIFTYIIDTVVIYNIEKYEHRINDERAKTERKFDYVVNSTTNNNSIAKDIRVYNMKPWIHKITDILLKEKLGWESKISNKHFLKLVFEAGIIFVRNGGALLYLIWKMTNTNMSIGDFTLYFGAITGFGVWLEQIVDRISKISAASFKIDDYRALIELKDKMKRDKGVPVPKPDEPIEIELKNVSFKYDGSDEFILNHINLTIHKGEKIAVVGSNGAGKTTLVKLICGLITPSTGSILVNGVDITKLCDTFLV